MDAHLLEGAPEGEGQAGGQIGVRCLVLARHDGQRLVEQSLAHVEVALEEGACQTKVQKDPTSWLLVSDAMQYIVMILQVMISDDI